MGAATLLAPAFQSPAPTAPQTPRDISLRGAAQRTSGSTFASQAAGAA
eukprot:CAMPEP_0195065420 /NCGR_PEP_ID=MMETSP0448-20130528/11085_1 /TAXON_ID=66468 /ORGANISM="Heterocapsa triquestra, Strain CCMP 448" /LENGTH=47 /DNA_ID= /DNA_START= /DNA_END= /DNA_ORIENTATION=